MPHTHGWHSCHQEPPALDHDQVGLVVPSFDQSCQQAYEGTGCHTIAVVGHWQLLPEVRRSRCFWWYATDRWLMEGSCAQPF